MAIHKCCWYWLFKGHMGIGNAVNGDARPASVFVMIVWQICQYWESCKYCIQNIVLIELIVMSPVDSVLILRVPKNKSVWAYKSQKGEVCPPLPSPPSLMSLKDEESGLHWKHLTIPVSAQTCYICSMVYLVKQVGLPAKSVMGLFMKFSWSWI